MAIAPIDQLFYPGVKSCRVACPIRTYHELEISDQTGIKNSCYRPKFVPASPEPPPPRKEKAAKKEKESKKASKESSSKKSDKGKKGKGKKEEGATQGQNLAHVRLIFFNFLTQRCSNSPQNSSIRCRCI